MKKIKMLLARVLLTKHTGEKGTTAVEYALMVSIITGAVALAIPPIATKIAAILTAVTTALNAA